MIPPIDNSNKSKYSIQSSQKKRKMNYFESTILYLKIDYYRRCRQENMELLPVCLKDEINKLESVMICLEKDYFDLFMCSSDTSKLEVTNLIKYKISRINSSYSILGFRRNLMERIFEGVATLEKFNFVKEIVLSVICTRAAYALEIEKNIRQNFPTIINEILDKNVDEIDLSKIEAFISYPEKETGAPQETHNRGKSVVFVELRLMGELFGKFVYKPRSSAIDKKVVDLFREINVSENLSTEESLPVYKIIDLGPHASACEYIKGTHIPGRLSVKEYISKRCLEKSSLQQRQLLRKKLNRMDAILSKIHVSDLHGENVIIRGLDGDNPEIVPVDLENIQPGFPTRLKGNPEKVTLTENEERLIREFNQDVNETPHRFILLGTEDLFLWVNFSSEPKAIVERTIKVLEKSGFELAIRAADLEDKLLEDLLNNDVPYFRRYRDKIYYGLDINEAAVIGKKVQEKDESESVLP